MRLAVCCFALLVALAACEGRCASCTGGKIDCSLCEGGQTDCNMCVDGTGSGPEGKCGLCRGRATTYCHSCEGKGTKACRWCGGTGRK